MSEVVSKDSLLARLKPHYGDEISLPIVRTLLHYRSEAAMVAAIRRSVFPIEVGKNFMGEPVISGEDLCAFMVFMLNSCD